MPNHLITADPPRSGVEGGSFTMEHDGVTTTPATLPDTAIESYRRQGFVHIPGILSRAEAEQFRLAAADALERLADKSLTRGRGAVERIFTQIVNVWREDEAMRRLTLHPNVGAVAERLAGIPLRLWHDHMLVKLPHNQAPTEFHQDRPYWPHATSRHTLSAWIALVDVPVERGCMTFIPGSHTRTDLRPQNLTDSEDLFRISPDLAWEPRVTVPLRAGDCTFHNGLCAHMALANQTDEIRFAHVVIFMDAETTYTGQRHVVTDPLGLSAGQRLDGELFPRVGQ
jgi:ectoine hydroxylase-related dioxygenase (phytanoyl-CoA dioxygenase family)